MGHWYTKEGEPCHFQENGKDTTMRDARKQNLVPGVTDILRVVNAHGLNVYKENQILKAAWENKDRLDGYESWCKEIRQKASEHSEENRNYGNEIHKMLDSYYRNGEYADNPIVERVTAALRDVYGIVMGNCTSEKTFATDAYGGSIDLIGEDIIIDFKTKKDGFKYLKSGKPKKMWFNNHIAQLCAYSEGAGPKNRLVNVYISPDDIYIHEWDLEDIIFGTEYFMRCLNLWRMENNFP